VRLGDLRSFLTRGINKRDEKTPAEWARDILAERRHF
jgi:hypothetical protein